MGGFATLPPPPNNAENPIGFPGLLPTFAPYSSFDPAVYGTMQEGRRVCGGTNGYNGIPTQNALTAVYECDLQYAPPAGPAPRPCPRAGSPRLRDVETIALGHRFRRQTARFWLDRTFRSPRSGRPDPAPRSAPPAIEVVRNGPPWSRGRHVHRVDPTRGDRGDLNMIAGMRTISTSGCSPRS